MKLVLVNQRIINGKLYEAWRDATNPRLQYIQYGHVRVQVKLSEVWSDDAKVEGLF